MEIIVISILVCIYYILHAVWMLVEKEGDRLFFQTSPNPIKEHHRYKPNWLVFDMIVGD